MTCNKCGAPMTVTASDFPGFNLLACSNCGRAVKLIPTTGPRPRGHKPQRRADVNRALRAARRHKMRHPE